MTELRAWARENGLIAAETAYVACTRDRRQLTFTESPDPAVERDYRTHWFSPAVSERKRERLVEQGRPPDLVVISAINPWTCASCGEELGKGALLMMEDPRPATPGPRVGRGG